MVDRLGRFNVGTILDYSVEGGRTEREFEAAAKEVMRTVDAAGEAAAAGKNVPFTVENGLTYLRGLAGEKRGKAREYIDRAPEEVLTPLRRELATKGWG